MTHWKRNFIAVWPSLFFVSMGLMAFLPALPLYLEERFGLTDPADVRWWSGTVFGAAPLAAALIGPLWGALGDSFGRKPMALRAILGVVLVTWLMPLAESPEQMTALRFLQGALAGYVAPAMSLVIADAPAEQHGRTLGRLQVAMAIGLLVGPAVGAEAAAAWGREAVFRLTSVLALAGAIPVALLAREDRGRLRAERPPGMLTAFRSFVDQPGILVLLFGFFLVRFGLLMVEAFLALWVDHLGPSEWLLDGTRDRAHAVDRTTAAMFVIYAVGQIAFTTWWGRLGDRRGPLRAYVMLSTGLAVTFLATAFVTSIHGFGLMRCAAAFFMAGSMTLAHAAIGKRVAPGSKSLAIACVQSCMQIGMFLGPLTGGWLSATFGLQALFIVSSVSLAVAAVVLFSVRLSEQNATTPSDVSPDRQPGS